MMKNVRIQLNPETELEVIAPVGELDRRLAEVDYEVAILDASIDKLTNHSEKLDYAVAAISGVLAGLFDILFVGKFDLQEGTDWSTEKVNEFVTKVAQRNGYEGDDLQGAIRHLEKFGAPSDSVYNEFGGGLQHHLRDFAHHASIVGLVFSLLTQFTRKAYGTKTDGSFHVVDVTNTTFIGETVPTKITFGLVYWLLHMASDMAGSSGSPGAGTGIPGPVMSVVKLLSTAPVFKNKDGVNELSQKVSKLFNGTLLAEHGEDGKILRGADGKPLIHKMDLRGELGVAHQLAKQALPVLINEGFVRGFYFVNRLVSELKEKESLGDVEWEKTLPFGNRTIERMMTVATGAFTLVDMLDAAIEGAINSKANWVEFFRQFALRLNFVGIGRVTIALGTDIVMGLQRGHKSQERLLLMAEALYLTEAKVYYGEALVWTAAKDATESIDKLYAAMRELSHQIEEDVKAIEFSAAAVHDLDAVAIDEHNPGLRKSILDIL